MSIYRYPGGKSKRSIMDKLWAKAPESFSEYREVACGGGSFIWDLTKERCKRRWINDIDEGLISVYKALKERPEAFIAACRAIKPHEEGEELTSSRDGGKKIHNARLKAVFDQFVADTKMDSALRYFFINRTNWGGRVDYSRPSRMYFSNHAGWNIVNTKALESAAKILKDVEITRMCMTAVLKAPGKNVFCYVDPPYVVDTNLPESSQLYAYSFKEEDHVRLASVIKKECPHKVMISYDDDPLVRDLYKEKDGFFIFEEEWAYCGTSSSEEVEDKEKKIGKELIITNYPMEEAVDMFADASIMNTEKNDEQQ